MMTQKEQLDWLRNYRRTLEWFKAEGENTKYLERMLEVFLDENPALAELNLGLIGTIEFLELHPDE